ncbi:MAG: hypothetical protein OXF41_22360 [bacterium]|nr:hypothetical protein [bacterium]
MTDGNVVEFETVHRRFEEAVEALKQLSELMGGLRDAEKVKERTAAAISDASDHLRDTSATLTSYCELLRSALDTTLEALQSAENLATGAELTAIRTEVTFNRAVLTRLVDNDNSLDRKLADLANRQSTITDTVDAIRNKLDGDLSQAQQSRDDALSELTETKNRLDRLETRLSGLPPKIRRKYDLDNL